MSVVWVVLCSLACYTVGLVIGCLLAWYAHNDVRKPVLRPHFRPGRVASLLAANLPVVRPGRKGIDKGAAHPPNCESGGLNKYPYEGD
jgi:hypothetical protein